MTFDDAALLKRFAATEKQLAFGVVNAINDAIKDLQQAEFARVRSEFTIRKPAFFFGSGGRIGGTAARITKFATVRDRRSGQSRAYAELAVQASSVSAQSRTLLQLFEAGGIRRPMTRSARAVAVPLTGRPARPTFASSVPQAFTFAGLGFRGFRRGKKLTKHRRGHTNVPETIFGEFGRVSRSQLTLGDVQWKGKNRTFILLHTMKSPEGGVFQRIGRERGSIIELYKFERPFALKARLGWIALAESLGPRLLHEHVQRQAADIIAHNAGRAA